MQASPAFQDLRSKFRAFVFPMTIAFLVWYFLYVLLAVYATDSDGEWLVPISSSYIGGMSDRSKSRRPSPSRSERTSM